MTKLRWIFFLIVLLLAGCAGNSEKIFSEEEINIIPLPKEMDLKPGSFRISDATKFVVENDQQKEIVELLNEKFTKAAGWELEVVEKKPGKNYIQLQRNEGMKEEAYRLQVAGERISIQASSASGFIYGLETLRQLLPKEIESKSVTGNVEWQVPQIEIFDEPNFVWRGLMLDVSRHFFEKDYILKVIDRLAFLKMNTLHLHLVDDQGWRIEIKKYPKLTEVGAFRVDQEGKPWNSRPAPEPGQETTYGGFYTQEEIREIVTYAQKRGIIVVPEIEMPAHVMSAIAAYPELSCTGEEIMVPSGGVWPITTIYCPGKESTFEFLENVMLEVMELFPSKYIHVGGDEATKTEWETCPHCQKRLKDEGLANTEKLQSYFIKRMEKFLSSHGRILIGWDEILEGGLAPGATVMSWRGTQGGWKASKGGHDVVMTPTSHMYFDYYQGNPDSEPVAFNGFVPLKKVYNFNPVVDSMSVAQKKHVLGGQANLWSEYIPTTEHSEYMMLPRLVALSEVLWSSRKRRNWADFSTRLKENILPRYDLQGIHFARSSFAVTSETEMDMEKKIVRVRLQNEYPDSEIRYAFDQERLDQNSSLYTQPIAVDQTTTIKAAVFEDGKQLGQTFTNKFQFHKAVGKKVSYNPAYHKNYQGAKEAGMVNVLRGSKNFHDGQWQAWLVKDMEVVIDMEKEIPVSTIEIGTLESQGSGIYFPVKVEAFLSMDGKEYRSVGLLEREFALNGNVELRDFTLQFPEQKTRYIKVTATNLKKNPQGGSSWIFVDEIVVE